MRSRILLLFILLVAAQARSVEPERPLQSNYVVRVGEQLQGPHVFTYRLVEFSQQRGRWILPDLGYYDSGNAQVRLWYTGVGAELMHNRRFEWTQIVYIAQQEGTTAQNQHMMWLWPVLDVNLTQRLTAELVLYPTIPLNRSAQWGFDLDRIKMEYALRPSLLAGVGYSASKCPTTAWINKPFLTATVNNRAGSWEVWVERMPNGAQLQLRYQLAPAVRQRPSAAPRQKKGAGIDGVP